MRGKTPIERGCFLISRDDDRSELGTDRVADRFAGDHDFAAGHKAVREVHLRVDDVWLVGVQRRQTRMKLRVETKAFPVDADRAPNRLPRVRKTICAGTPGLYAFDCLCAFAPPRETVLSADDRRCTQIQSLLICVHLRNLRIRLSESAPDSPPANRENSAATDSKPASRPPDARRGSLSRSRA